MFKTHIKKILKETGLSHDKSELIKDLTCQYIDPISLSYLGHGKTFLLRVKLERCIFADFMAFRAGFNSNSPIIKTIIDYHKGRVTRFNNSKLHEMYKFYTPKNAKEYIGLVNPYYKKFNYLEPSAALWPWSTSTPEKTLKKRNEINNRETGEFKKGDKFFGPVSQKKGCREFNRYIKMYKEIRKNGLKLNKLGHENIKGFFLVSDKFNKSACIIKQGHHRVAVLSALGYTHITIQNSETGCGSIVRREDVLSWPAVRNGYFTKNEALYIFDRLLEGKQPYSNIK